MQQGGSGGVLSKDRREQADKLGALRAALMAGEQSGPAAPLDFEAFIARKRDVQHPAE